MLTTCAVLCCGAACCAVVCHVMLCCAGFREAEAVAKAELDSAAFSNVEQPVAFRSDLLNIARTTLSSKILTGMCVCCHLRTCLFSLSGTSTTVPP